MSQQTGDVTSDDKLWAALAYFLSPWVSILILLMEDKKNRPFLKAHNMQALVWGAAAWILVSVLSFVGIGVCLVPVVLIVNIYWAYKAYQGNLINIPVLTDFVKNQGWA